MDSGSKLFLVGWLCFLYHAYEFVSALVTGEAGGFASLMSPPGDPPSFDTDPAVVIIFMLYCLLFMAIGVYIIRHTRSQVR